MAYSVGDWVSLQVDASTKGGYTYYVDGESKCFRPCWKRKDQFCAQAAGWKTDHAGTGPCTHHGGATEQAHAERIKTGRYSAVVYRDFKRQYHEFIVDPDMLDLMPELALARSILARETKRYSRNTSTGLRLMKYVLDIVKIVESIERIQSQQVLTASTVRLMMARGLEVAKLFIPPDQLVDFVEAWRSEPTVKMSAFLPEAIEVDE